MTHVVIGAPLLQREFYRILSHASNPLLNRLGPVPPEESRGSRHLENDIKVKK